ncbi:isoleucyl-tRNA synthetase [Moorella thermoacetica Y72]|uniref:Isoleucyl-tRNA synthetase n=1 Tax=Moorella thermoacetica Y72 TaxID=1325331 RepID=A0A0S6UGM3_NEOTH|nr:isoleucyl-tRNA synthetase [Moorella thermoacetica Y72]
MALGALYFNIVVLVVIIVEVFVFFILILVFIFVFVFVVDLVFQVVEVLVNALQVLFQFLVVFVQVVDGVSHFFHDLHYLPQEAGFLALGIEIHPRHQPLEVSYLFPQVFHPGHSFPSTLLLLPALTGLKLSPLDILAGTGVDAHDISRFDKEGYLDDGPGFQDGVLGTASGRIALDARLRFHDLQLHRVRQFDANGLPVVSKDEDVHVILQVLNSVLQLLLPQG